MSLIYPGLKPSNVGKDAKYSVKRGRDGMEVHLTFRLNSRERVLLSTNSHPKLVEMVNAVKEEVNGQPGGAFYINEFGDVLVPADGDCYFAGIYEGVLEFDFDGVPVSPIASTGLQPGDDWEGPHVGIRYTLMAGGRDIKFELVNGRVRKEVRLSDEVGEVAAERLARRLARVKGSDGGRIYMNERSEFFAPGVTDGPEHVYLGGMGEDPWFAPPDVPGRE